MLETSDIELLYKFRDDDRAAFTELYKRYYPRLFKYILHYVKIPSVAEDLLQDVFVKLWDIRARIKPELGISAYLYRICRNQVFSFLKRVATDEKMRQKMMEHLQEEAEGVEEQTRWKQYQLMLRTAVEQLPPQRQRVFRLCREQKKTYEEAARELGISQHTVKEHMTESLKYIRNFFIRHGTLSLAMVVLFQTGY